MSTKTDLTPEPPEDDSDFTDEQRKAFDSLVSSAFTPVSVTDGDAAYLKGAAFGSFIRGVWSSAFQEPSYVTNESLSQVLMGYVHSSRDGGF